MSVLKLWHIIGIIGLAYEFMAIMAIFYKATDAFFVCLFTGLLMIPLGFISEKKEAK